MFFPSIARVARSGAFSSIEPPPPPPPPPPPGGFVSLAFTEDTTTDFLNPERGFHTEYGPSAGSQLANCRTLGYSINRVYFRLDSYRTSNIPTSVLNSYYTYFGQARAAGVKIIPRWSYNFGPWPVSEPDAPLSWVLTHIGQLGPVWRDNADVIAVLQAGFIGAWGEWHSSTNGLNTPTNMKIILEAILDQLPNSRMTQVRTPGYMRSMYGNTPLQFQNRFTTGYLPRMGFKNDCFQTNGSDAGTYNNQADRDYISAMGPLTCVGGETCEVSGVNSTNDCAPSVANLSLQGWDYLNDFFYTPVLNKWASQGCKPAIRRNLGYRLALTGGEAPASVSPGGPMTLKLTIKNAGYGKVYNPRPIDLVFVGPGGPFTLRLEEDARRKLPLGGQTVNLEWNITAPTGLQNGQSYALHLRFPDASASIANDSRYCIRLANTSGWDSSTGRNSLGHSVVVGSPYAVLGVGSFSNSLVDYPKTGPVYTGNIWVDPKLSSNGSGTQASPFNNLTSALNAVQDGQRIIVRSGTIAPSTRFNRGVNWNTGIQIFAYGNERPVLDCVNLGSGANGRILNLYGRREHWKGFEVINGKINDQALSFSGPATQYTFEDFRIHDCLGGGIMVGNFSGEGAGGNLFMDVWVYRLGDGVSVGTNTGDAFGFTASIGDITQNNILVRCLAANGPDDNFDAFRGRGTRFIDCVSIGAGYYWNGNIGSSGWGDGAGFKMGGSDSNAGDNHAIGCLAINSRSGAFSYNVASNTSGTNPNIVFQRCTAFGSGNYGYDIGGSNANQRNRAEDCISFNNNVNRYIDSFATEVRNTWNLGILNPVFSNTSTYDFSLAQASPCIGAGLGGGNLGASTVALSLAKEYFLTILQ